MAQKFRGYPIHLSLLSQVLSKHNEIPYAIYSERNGYVHAPNSIIFQPLTGNEMKCIVGHRVELRLNLTHQLH
jgi:hypothetical protein